MKTIVLSILNGDNMYAIIIYDVDKKQDPKILKILRKYCFHVQKSVFEAELTPKQYQELKSQLDNFKLLDNHSIIIYTVLSHKEIKKDILGHPKNKDILLY